MIKALTVLMTIVRIAAFDSSDADKAAADIVCTGTHDEITIQQVLDKFEGNNTDTCEIYFADGTTEMQPIARLSSFRR